MFPFNSKVPYWRLDLNEMILEHLFRFWKVPITSEMFVNFFVNFEHVRYFGIVRTVPTYTLWHLGIWSGCVSFWPFLFTTSCWRLATAVSELYSAMTAHDWILAKKSSRTFCSPRWFGARRRHLYVKKEHEVPMMFCIAREFRKGIWMNHFVLE